MADKFGSGLTLLVVEDDSPGNSERGIVSDNPECLRQRVADGRIEPVTKIPAIHVLLPILPDLVPDSSCSSDSPQSRPSRLLHPAR